MSSKDILKLKENIHIHALSIVIARYNEDLSWLKILSELASICPITLYIYDKSEDKKIDSNKLSKELQFASIKYTELPNIGREGHTFLYHVLNCLETEEAIKKNHYTIFLQGRVDDHLGNSEQIIKHLLNIISDAVIHDRSLSFAKAHKFKEHSATYNFKIAEWKGELKANKLSFGPWFKEFVCAEFPSEVKWWVGALFCIHDIIMPQKSKSYYEKILSELDTKNPEAVHFLERSWLYVFS